jgi:hypothetical protein
MTTFDCPTCHAPANIEAFLSAVSGYDRSTNSAFSNYLSCKVPIEFQVRDGKLVLGYTYSSGALHFEGLYDVTAKGLRCIVEQQGVYYIYKGKRYEVPGTEGHE